MLLNEFLKEHQKVETLEATVADQKTEFEAAIARQEKQINALTATVQKVSNELALRQATPRVAANAR